jgi:exopolyphosphatase/guanosine-5'-triphosphate,3'-diphosphate pyrophosphatase
VLSFAERCHYEEPHSKQVQRLALQLFDALGARLGCDPSDRQTLSDAALLHDVGYHINYEDHHKHSFHLIHHADLLGVPPDEQLMIALVARYHRGAEPKRKHEAFWALDRTARERVRRLSAILRVADGFDRGHVSAIDRIKVRWMERALRLTPVPRRSSNSLRLELWGADRKSGLLAELAGVPVEVVSPAGDVVGTSEPGAAAEE